MEDELLGTAVVVWLTKLLILCWEQMMLEIENMYKLLAYPGWGNYLKGDK